MAATQQSRMDAMGDRQKMLEGREAQERFMPGLPIVVRLDGRAFHTFTKGLDRPFDARFSEAMQETTKFLVDESHATIGYTQSDEISLVYIPKDDRSHVPMFEGRKDKLKTILAGLATAKFNQMIFRLIPEKANALPVFDCRAYNTPSLALAAEALEWREMDATKNSITMAAHSLFSHKELQGVNGFDKLAMMEEKGVIWGNYPTHFKRGVYLRRGTKERYLSEDELARIPEKHRPTGPVLRSSVDVIDLPPLTRVANVVDVLFHKAAPVMRAARQVETA